MRPVSTAQQVQLDSDKACVLQSSAQGMHAGLSTSAACDASPGCGSSMLSCCSSRPWSASQAALRRTCVCKRADVAGPCMLPDWLGPLGRS